MADGWERTVPCEDGSGRPRELRLFITDTGKIAFQVPPGEVAIVDPQLADQLRSLITSAQLEAVQQRGKW